MHILSATLLSFLAFSSLTFSSLASAETKNGFELSQSLIPANQILQGGPPRDGIPSIDRPDFIPAAKADFLQPLTASIKPIRLRSWL